MMALLQLIYLALSIALTNLLFRLSAREFCNDNTAHNAAGSQPIKVI
jgi:hypothetical protein